METRCGQKYFKTEKKYLSEIYILYRKVFRKNMKTVYLKIRIFLPSSVKPKITNDDVNVMNLYRFPNRSACQ